MSGELKILTADGDIVWFGRDERFPAEVRVYTGDTRRWDYMPLNQVRQIVDDGLGNGGEVQQGDPVLFFRAEDQDTVG
jgi:hypothetical protein